MSYPAFASFFADTERTPARAAVYMAIQPPHLDFARPRPLKVEAVAIAARVSKGSAVDGINWLLERGYLALHAKDGRGVRSVTLAFALSTPRAPSHPVPHGAR